VSRIFRYDYQGSDQVGCAIWSCTTDGAGVCGYGATQKEALVDFLDLEEMVLPTSREMEIEDEVNEALANGEYR
jgi:hypothetical protein